MARKAKSTTNRVQWLETRVKELEQLTAQRQQAELHPSDNNISAHDGCMSPTDPVDRVPCSDSLESQLQTSSLPIFSGDSLPIASARTGPDERASQQSILVAPVQRSSNSEPRESTINAGQGTLLDGQPVHAIIGPSEDDCQTDEFFGVSSAGSFMQNVRRMVEKKLGQESSLAYSASGRRHSALPRTGLTHEATNKHTDYVLPPRRVADRLMTAYWRHVHIIDPYLDKAQMQDDYEKIWQGDSTIDDERSTLCLLNVIFALSSQLDESLIPTERERTANSYYLRARELLDVLETGSVRSVQYCLLLGEYFQGTGDSHPCWIFVGLAIRTAQSLGLHLAETSERITDLRTRQVMRKVWHGCILMDRVLSMTYGRPCMIGPRAAAAVPLPLALDDDHTTSENTGQGHSSAQPRSLMDFFISSLKLYDILHDVIFNFYSVNSQRDRQRNWPHDRPLDPIEGNPSVFELERRLSGWENSLPLHLKIANPFQHEDMEYATRRQAIILHQRYLSRSFFCLAQHTNKVKTAPRSLVASEAYPF
ncbi:hypothetical protein H2198_003818 [Neophaeococcomyces mojaviensis]|uniref:Uncharacterized protein n=1 Tax=Neophaeococcomyces mojaviensis TaxID=3383035 RepID=A0ACC3AAG0_9EURO|nr:hypothetical protein H2198_003818 [Knufia sp. JES_112]